MVVLVLAALVVVEAKKKPNNNKFEGDFEFVDEVSHKKNLLFDPFSLGLIFWCFRIVCVCVCVFVGKLPHPPFSLKGLQHSI